MTPKQALDVLSNLAQERIVCAQQDGHAFTADMIRQNAQAAIDVLAEIVKDPETPPVQL